MGNYASTTNNVDVISLDNTNNLTTPLLNNDVLLNSTTPINNDTTTPPINNDTTTLLNNNDTTTLLNDINTTTLLNDIDTTIPPLNNDVSVNDITPLFNENNDVQIILPIENNEQKNQIIDENDNHLSDEYAHIFLETDLTARPEKNNRVYANEALKIKNIKEIINKTYTVDPLLDENSKICHEKLRQYKLFKITNINESHYSYFYKTGLNELLHCSFNMTNMCTSGGLYFTTEGMILNYLGYGVYVREIFLCPDSAVVFIDDKFSKYKTNKFIIGKRKLIDHEFIEFNCDKYIGDINNFKIYKDIYNFLTDETQFIEANIYKYLKQMRPYIFILYIQDNYKYKNKLYLSLLVAYKDKYKIIFEMYVNMLNPSQEVSLLAIDFNPRVITKVKNPNFEMISSAMKKYTTVKMLNNIGLNIQTYEILQQYFTEQNMLHNITYLKTINDEYQDALMKKSKLNIMLISNPTKESIDQCVNDKILDCYYQMYNKNYNDYKINNVDKYICNRFNNMLYNYFDNKYKQFKEELVNYNGYMSGSFICNVMYNVCFTCSDIDIYFNNYDNAMKFGDTLKQFGYLRTSITTYSAYSLVSVHINKIITHKSIRKNNINIQLIVLNEKINVVNYIMTYFDIDFCKVIADGNDNFYAPDSVINKNDTTISQHIFNVFELTKKNMEMYFNSKHNDDTVNNYYKRTFDSTLYYLSKVENRVKKYTDRRVKFDENNIKSFKLLSLQIKNMTLKFYAINAISTITNSIVTTFA